MYKKVISIFLVALLLAGIPAGCGSDNNDVADNIAGNAAIGNNDGNDSAAGNVVVNDITDNMGDNIASSYAETKVGICIYQLNDDFMSLFYREIVDYLVSKGFSNDNILVYGSDNNESTQLSQVQSMIGEGVDALIVNPVNSGVVPLITQQAVDRNIPLVYINREPNAEDEIRWEDYDLDVTYVGCDARQSGIYQAEILLDLGEEVLDLNGDGKIQFFMIEGAPENIDAEYRTFYSVSTLVDAGFDMDCIFDEVGNWDNATSRQLVIKALKSGLKPEVIICNNDAMALGALDAAVGRGYIPGKDVYIVGVDALSQALNFVELGTMAGTVFNDYITQAHNAGDAVITYLEGGKNEHFIGCDYIKVDSSNVREIKKLIKNND